MINFKKFERLSKTEYAKSNARLRLSGVIRNLIVEEGLVENSQIEQIIEQVAKDRFNLGKAKADFVQTLDPNDPEACKVIIALCYYAMYHSCRAAVRTGLLRKPRFIRIGMIWILMRKSHTRFAI